MSTERKRAVSFYINKQCHNGSNPVDSGARARVVGSARRDSQTWPTRKRYETHRFLASRDLARVAATRAVTARRVTDAARSNPVDGGRLDSRERRVDGLATTRAVQTVEDGGLGLEIISTRRSHAGGGRNATATAAVGRAGFRACSVIGVGARSHDPRAAMRSGRLFRRLGRTLARSGGPRHAKVIEEEDWRVEASWGGRNDARATRTKTD